MSDSILLEAEDLTNGARQRDYGHPLDDYRKVAGLWSIVLDTPVSPSQAVMCMICVKLSRELNRPKRDNRVDMAGYANCLDKIEQRLAASPEPTAMTLEALLREAIAEADAEIETKAAKPRSHPGVVTICSEADLFEGIESGRIVPVPIPKQAKWSDEDEF